VAERAPRDNSERLLRGAACRDVKVLLGLALVSLLAAGEGLSSDASPGASLDWTKEDPQHVTKHLLNQVQSATKAWNKIPGQLRQLKKVKKNIVTIEANAGKAVAGLQGEMDKAYAVLAGSDKIDQPTTQVDNKTDVTSKPNPRANAAAKAQVRFFAPQLPRRRDGVLPCADLMLGAPDDYLVLQIVVGAPASKPAESPSAPAGSQDTQAERRKGRKRGGASGG